LAAALAEAEEQKPGREPSAWITRDLKMLPSSMIARSSVWNLVFRCSGARVAKGQDGFRRPGLGKGG
jgi:hypothetical protein